MFMKGSDAQSLEKTFMRKFAQIDRLYEAKENHEQTIKSIVKKFQSDLQQVWSRKIRCF